MRLKRNHMYIQSLKDTVISGKQYILVRHYFGTLRMKVVQKYVHFNKIILSLGWMENELGLDRKNELESRKIHWTIFRGIYKEDAGGRHVGGKERNSDELRREN